MKSSGSMTLAALALGVALFLCPNASASHTLLQNASIGQTGGNGAFEAVWGGHKESGLFFVTREQLVSADTDAKLDVYERASGVTNLISIGPNGGNGPSDATFSGASADGTKVFFQTPESLLTTDTDSTVDVYQRSGGITSILSQGPNGGNGSSDAFYVGNNHDGSRVWFISYESLVSSDSDSNRKDVYERFGSTTSHISTSATSPNGNFGADFAGASQNGSRVFFYTDESMVAADSDGNNRDVYERTGGATALVSIGPAPGAGTNAQKAFWGGASADGTRVFFVSTEKLTTDDTDGTCVDEFGATVQCSDVYERSGGTTTLVSTSPTSPNGPYRAGFAGNTPDGSRVFFQTDEPLVSADTDGPPTAGCEDPDGFPTLRCIDVYERAAGTTTLVSTSATSPNSASTAVFRAVSQNGTRVFFSTDEQLVGTDTDSVADIYERTAGNTTLISSGGNGGFDASFDAISADGSRVFFETYESLTAGDADGGWLDVYERFAGQTYLLSTGPNGGSGTNVAFFAGATPDGTRVFFQTEESLVSTDTDGQLDVYAKSISPEGYVRPQSASPLNLRLVPAYESCEDPNGSHGGPLAASSCNPAVQSSDFLTVGSPEANGLPAKFVGSLVLKVVGENPIDPDNGDQADVEITASLTDVRNQSNLSDYTGELRAVLGLRVTDRYNGAWLDNPATVIDSSFGFNLSCSPTGGPEGGTCNVTTTADAVMGPNMARERQRAIWEVSQVEVFDGGSDGDADTAGDNTLFAVQGLFAP